MSQLILNWLNQEVQLSKRITNFETDFTNGYLFGQILAKYNQQLNFSDFVNKQDKNSRLKNFGLLFQTFKSLRITFNSNIVTDIMNQKQGVSKKILYELKMQLQKSSTNYFSKVSKSSTLTPLKKVQISKQKKDLVDIQLFKKRINQNHRAQKKINQDNVLKKFSDFHKTQIQKTKQQIKQAQQKSLLAKEAERNKLRNTLKRQSQFHQQWQKSNKEKWEKNMDYRKLQNEKDILYRAKIQNQKKKYQTIKQSMAIKQVGSEIQQFQNKFLKKNQNQQNSSDEEPQKIYKKTSREQNVNANNKTLNMSATIPTNNIRIKKVPQLEEIYRRQRDKRRRKMIVDQNKHQNLIQLEKRQQQILYCIDQTSKQQKQIQYQIWRAWQNKQVIIENRKLRQNKYNQKKQIKQINNKFKNEQLIKVFRQQHQEDIQQKMIRQNQLSIANKVNLRKQNYKECNQMIMHMLDIAQQCFKNQQNLNTNKIEGDQLNQAIQCFVQNKYLPTHKAEMDLSNYINGQKNWKLTVQRNNNQPQQPEKQNSLPNSSINNYYLGNILKNIFKKYYSFTDKQPQMLNLHIQLGICLLGLQFAGKKSISKSIAKKYNLHIINIQQLILKKIQSMKLLQNQNLISSNIGVQLSQNANYGKQIKNQAIIQLIRQQIKKYPRFLLINYPLSYNQSILLTEALSNIKPHDYIKKSNLQTKIYNFSKLVKPTQTTLIQRQIKSCGIDLIIWIDIKPQVSLDRCIGRRWIGEKNYHINQNLDSIDANLLQIKDRGASLVERNSYKLNNINQVKQWFTNFGINIKNQNDVYKLNCWQNISGNKSQSQVYIDVQNMFKQLVEYKKIYGENETKLKLLKENEQKARIQKGKLEQEIKKKCVLTNQVQVDKKLSQALQKVQMNRNFINNMVQFWNKIEQSTINSYLKVFIQIRDQRQKNKDKFAKLKRKFISQLVRPDNKFNIVKNFQLNYNQFIDNNKDMLQQQLTKQQLHQRVQDLQDKLLTIAQTKKQQAIQQRNQIINSGWLQAQLERFYLIIQLLVSNQIQRSLSCQQIINDFYAAAYSIQAKQISESNNDLVIQNSLEIISNDNNDFPRIQKLFTEATRIFNKQQPQLIDDKNKKGGKVPPKKQEKKAAKKGGKQEVQQKKQPTKQQLEMSAAINTEKAIFRYRMNILKQFTKKNLRKIKQNTISFYNNLEDILIYTNKVQIQAIRKISKIFRQNIEKQNKIQTEIQLNYVDIIVSQKILNFQDPKPLVLSAKQKNYPHRFSISQLKFLIQNIQNQSQKNYRRIINRKLITILIRFTQNRQTAMAFPQVWRNKNLSDYQKMISLLDPQNLGYVNLRDLFTLFILTDCRLPTNQEKSKYEADLKRNSKQGLIDLNNFCKVKGWFQKQQLQKKLQNVNTFNRPFHLKSLLFQTIKDTDKNQVNIEKYIRTITMDIIKKQKTLNLTYHDLIFGK